MPGDANYRKINDGSHNSSTYHKDDGTAARAILKRETEKMVEEATTNAPDPERLRLSAELRERLRDAGLDPDSLPPERINALVDRYVEKLDEYRDDGYAAGLAVGEDVGYASGLEAGRDD